MSSTETPGLQRLDLDSPEAGIIAYSVEGKVTAEQAQSVFDQIDAAAAAGRKVRLYYELHGFPKAKASVFFEKFKHLGTILKTVERMAIVGDQRWLAAYAAVFDPITKAELKHFTNEEKDAAADWIRA